MGYQPTGNKPGRPPREDYDNLSWGAKNVVTKRWGFCLKALNEILGWNLQPFELTRMFRGDRMPREKVEEVLRSLTMFALKHNFPESDLDDIYSPDGGQ